MSLSDENDADVHHFEFLIALVRLSTLLGCTNFPVSNKGILSPYPNNLYIFNFKQIPCWAVKLNALLSADLEEKINLYEKACIIILIGKKPWGYPTYHKFLF